MVSLRRPKSYINKLVKTWSVPNNNCVTNKEIVILTKSTVLNYVMNPLIGAVDTFWISKLNNNAMLAGQGTSDWIFNSVYMISSFAPNVIIPIVSGYHAKGDVTNVKTVISTSVLLVSLIGILISSTVFFLRETVVSAIIPSNGNSYKYAIQYLEIRIVSLVFGLLNSLAFSAMRGQKDVNTPVKINLCSQLVNMILDPILMIKMGVRGIALGTVISELVAFVLFYFSLIRKKLIDISLIDKKIIILMLKRGVNVQIRSVCLSLSYLLGFRQAQQIDLTGNSAAAHVLLMQLFEVGYILTYSISLICPILIPRYSNSRLVEKKLYIFGGIASIITMFINYAISNKVFTIFSKNSDVIEIAKGVIPIASGLQFVSGLTCITEGIIQGYGMYNIIGNGTVISMCLFFSFIRNIKTLPELWLLMCLSTGLRGFVNNGLMKIQKYKENED
tara:strand:+ start:3708 stop:5045 length:1338 start_codon:yes stop_codon:yes gene_type:complete